MNIRQNLVDTLNERAEAIGKLVTRRGELENDVKSGRFTAAAVANELQPELMNVRMAIDRTKDETRQAVARLVNQYVGELDKADALNPDELNEGDVKLLNSGVDLTKRDLTVMLSRNQGNRTMTQLILRWARAHDVDMGVTYIGNEKAIADAKQIPGVVDLWIDHWSDQPNARDMVQRMFVDTAGA